MLDYKEKLKSKISLSICRCAIGPVKKFVYLTRTSVFEIETKPTVFPENNEDSFDENEENTFFVFVSEYPQIDKKDEEVSDDYYYEKALHKY